MDWYMNNTKSVETQSSKNIISRTTFSTQSFLSTTFGGLCIDSSRNILKKPIKMFDEGKQNSNGNVVNSLEELAKNIVLRDEEGNYKTWDKKTHDVFIVSDEMLVYRGKRYLPSDIAQLWKKDCRTWLWKKNMKKRKHCGMIEQAARKRSKTVVMPSK